ncbi:MAG: hypothetical protein J6Q54_02150 [Oscillospiraceae bacterium]|nr:hypothetical protein [Oscillospiraceae bacterium]
MKKLLALLLAALMVLSLLAACGDDISKGDTAVPGGNQGENGTTPVTGFSSGSVVLNAGAAFSILYDKDGNVTAIEGMDERYKEFLDFLGEESQYVGLSCEEVVAELIKSIGVKGYLTDRGYVIIKQDHESALPKENFMESLQKSAEKALETVASDIPLVVITAQQLDTNGYIDTATAKTLVEYFLGYELINFDGTSLPVGGVYAFTAGTEDEEENLLVNAVTGTVDYGIMEGLEEDPDAEASEETDPIEENVEETIAPTEAPEENPTEAATEPSVNEG